MTENATATTTIGKMVRRTIPLVLALFLTQNMAAQLKQFTLEDLNFGGNNYHNMRPKNMYLRWWGDKLMYQDAEEWGTVDMKTGSKTAVATLDKVDAAMGNGKVASAMNVAFPYPGSPLALLKNSKERVLYDWKVGKVVWRQPCEGEQYSDWTAETRAVAFVRDNQLCVTDAEGATRTLTTDGSRDIVYGQAVHRNEFGIMKGTFWSPDGKRLAFYRMDQSMVTDYPQVNTFTRIATEEPDKYPMAGMTSHKVTVGAGRFGPYILHNKKYVSLPKEDDPLTVTLGKAVALIEKKRLLEQQRHIKTFNGDNPIEVLNGRYSPYIAYDGKNYRLPKAMHARAADLTLEECVEVIDAAEQKSEQKKK